MSVTQEDLQYLPYNDQNLGRIFTRDCKENIKLFIKEFRESEFGAHLVSEGLAHSDNLDTILEATQKQFGHDDVNMTEFTRVAKSLWMNGDLEPEQHAAAAVPAEPELTEPQLRWREYREFSETHSGDQCRARARVDAGYRSFMQKNREREMSPVGDAAENLLDRTKASAKKVSDDVRQFADDYRHMSSAQLRSLLSPASSGAEAAAHYQSLYEQAIAAALI
jgi:hypothetical protein